jgi:hypothetical protein
MIGPPHIAVHPGRHFRAATDHVVHGQATAIESALTAGAA